MLAVLGEGGGKRFPGRLEGLDTFRDCGEGCEHSPVRKAELDPPRRRLMRNITRRLAVASPAVPLVLIALGGWTARAAAAAEGTARAVCVFSNPSFAGHCRETTDVQPGSSLRQPCEEILACLNNAACIKNYCEATTIRQGWTLDSARAADDAP